MSECSAPMRSHRKPGSERNCPVHGAPRGRVAPGPASGPWSPPGRPAIGSTLVVGEADPGRGDDFALANDPDTSPEVLEQLVATGRTRMREIVARHRNAPVDLLDALSRDSDMYVRMGIAGNPCTPVDMLKRLADDRVTTVRTRVAENPATPDELIARLALAGWGSSRPPVPLSPIASRQLSELIAGQADAEVKEAAVLASNARIAAALGVHEANAAALESLREQAWWDMTPASPAVILAVALSPNP